MTPPALLQGWTLEIRAGPLPAPIVIDLTGAATDESGPGLLTRALRPTYTVKQNGQSVYAVSPAGAAKSKEWVLWFAVAVMLILMIVLR